MCGRFALQSDKTHIEAHYGLADAPAFSAGYNIAYSGEDEHRFRRNVNT